MAQHRLLQREKVKRQSFWHYVISRKPNLITAFVSASRIFWEFFTGFLFISRFTKSVSFFGSARETLPEVYYRDSEELASRLSMKGFAVITGGNGGVMRSANRGSFRAQGKSVGVSIKLPQEQDVNSFLNHRKVFQYFFSRKTILSCGSELYIFFPGGFGTLDELFEMLTLVQTKRSDTVPILLYGKSFWNPLVTFIQQTLAEKYKTILPKEGSDLFSIVDSVNEAEHYIDSLNITQTRNCKIDFGKMQ